MNAKKIGDKQQISIENLRLDCTITGIRKIETESTKGTLERYEIEGYGETQEYFIPDNCILDEYTQRRKSRSMMPLEYVYKDAKDFDWTVYNEDVGIQKNIVNAFVVNFDMFLKQGRGLYISSETKGSGKTLLACCIVNELLKRNDSSMKYCTVPEYIELSKSKDEDAKETLNSLKECKVLIFDDIGTVTDKQEWIANAIFRLIDYRDKNLLPTIYTSNYKIHDLPIDERVISRIDGHSVPVYVPEKNIRQMKSSELTREFLRTVLANGSEGIF